MHSIARSLAKLTEASAKVQRSLPQREPSEREQSKQEMMRTFAPLEAIKVIEKALE